MVKTPNQDHCSSYRADGSEDLQGRRSIGFNFNHGIGEWNFIAKKQNRLLDRKLLRENIKDKGKSDKSFLRDSRKLVGFATFTFGSGKTGPCKYVHREGPGA